MKTRFVQCVVLTPLIAAAWIGGASAQGLPDSLVQRLRAGAARIVVPGDSVVLPLVGTATLPLVEVRINAAGPYRFLIDLGSNVTLLRKDVVDASRSTVLVERATTDIVLIETIRLGEARLEDVTVASYDELDVDGVLGYNALQYSSFTLDLPRQRLVLHHRSLPPPDGRTVFSYRLQGRMPVIMVSVGTDSLLLNLDTGATEWMTVPPARQASLRWLAAPAPGRSVCNNQTGCTHVLEGYLADTLRFGALVVPSPLVYVNPDADDAWLGAAAMQGTVWTFDPRQQRVEVTAERSSDTPSATGYQLALDSAAIRRTALDYIEGWFSGDSARMARALAPELRKRILVVDEEGGRRWVDDMGFSKLVWGTVRGFGSEVPEAERRAAVTILDLFGNAASVKVDAGPWIDYLHLVRLDDGWKILNVLWELRAP